MFKKILSVALLIFALCACKKTPVDETVPVESVSLNQTEAEMLVGETLQLQAQISPSNATDKTLMWGSSKQSVATVSDAGLVTAVAEGSSKITVTASGKIATCTVTVTKPDGPVDPVESVHVESISLDREDAQLEVGGTLTLTATVLPDNADDKSVTWQSTNPEIAEVDQNGNVTAISSGTVTITATTTDGGKVAGCEITVAAAKPQDEHDGEENGHYWVDMGLPSGIKWATCNVGADYSAQVGSLFAWGETFARESSENPPYTWFDSATGKYTKYVNDSYYGNVDNLTTLEMEDDAAHVQWGGEWRMATAADAMELVENSTYEFTQQNGAWGAKLTSKNNGHSIFLPVQFSDYLYGRYLTSSLDWTTSSRIFTIDDESIDPYRSGLYRGEICLVRPVIGTTTYIPVESIDYDYTEAAMTLGSTRTLRAWAVPDNATNNTVVWTSLNESVATVDSNGNVTAVGVGYAYIEASAGGQSFTFCFEVIPLLESITIEPAELTLEIGQSATVTVASTPQRVLKYYSPGYANRNDNVIDVECTGGIHHDYYSTDPSTFLITAKAGGEATFEYFATVNGETIVATCHVTVPYVDDDYDGETDGHKWVDLGLPSGIKWATCNVGAEYSTQIGSLLAWGEGDNDPVKANWGGSWRMPTLNDLEELRANVNFEWTTYKGVDGVKLTSKNNGHSIFMAANNRFDGLYLTSTLEYESAIGIFFSSDYFSITYLNLDSQYPARAVIGEEPYVPVESVSFGYSHDFLTVGDTKQLTVHISPSNATNKKITWSSSNESVAVVDSHGILTCVGAGQCWITATVDGKEADVILRVDPVVNVTFEPASLTLKVGESADVTVKLDPDVPLSTYGLSQSTPWIINVQSISDNPIVYRVTGLEAGTGEFSFSATSKSYDYYVTVTND